MIAAPLGDPVLREQLDRIAPDGLFFFTLGSPEGPKGGELRGALVNASRLVAQMRANHGLGIIESYVLGQAYVAAALLASTLKGEDSIGMRLDCEGPVHGWSVHAKAGAEGFSVRGYLFRDVIAIAEPPDRFDTAPLVGTGTLTLTRFIETAPRPFTGTVSLKTGRLALDLASYFLESEQVPTAFALGVHFDREGRVAGAGGLFLQSLPGSTPASLERAEVLLRSLPPLGRHFAEGGQAEVLLATTFSALGLELRGGAPIAFSCNCGRERFAAFMAGAEGGLLEELVETGPWPVEAVCHQCGSKYHWEREELAAMLEKRPSSG